MKTQTSPPQLTLAQRFHQTARIATDLAHEQQRMLTAREQEFIRITTQLATAAEHSEHQSSKQIRSLPAQMEQRS